MAISPVIHIENHCAADKEIRAGNRPEFQEFEVERNACGEFSEFFKRAAQRELFLLDLLRVLLVLGHFQERVILSELLGLYSVGLGLRRPELFLHDMLPLIIENFLPFVLVQRLR